VSLGEPDLKRALTWVLERLAEDPRAPGGGRDLTPLEAEFLYAKLIEATRTPPDQGGTSSSATPPG
jgi:hypothetical protein